MPSCDSFRLRLRHEVEKWENHEVALALYFAFYNYSRPQMTLTADVRRKTTPAMASGLMDRV